MESIRIREPRPGDAEPLEALITAHFSEGSSYGVDLGIDDPAFHLRVAEADGDVVGVMGVRILTDADAVADEMYFFDDPALIPDAERYGHLETGYVRPDATGRGIGSRLLERIEEIGRDRGVGLFVVDAWYHGGDDSPERLFDRYGYETVHRDPIERPVSECPKCVGECTCDGALAVRREA